MMIAYIQQETKLLEEQVLNPDVVRQLDYITYFKHCFVNLNLIQGLHILLWNGSTKRLGKYKYVFR